MADLVWTVTYYGSLNDPTKSLPDAYAHVALTPRLAYVPAESGDVAVICLYDELKKRRDRQESARDAWLAAGKPITVNQLITAIYPLERETWTAVRGRQGSGRGVLDLTEGS